MRQEYPKVQVQLVVSSAALDLVRRDADVALRLFRETNPALVARKIGEVGWSVYASRAYLERTKFALDEKSKRSLEGQAVVGYAGSAGRSAGALWVFENCRPEDIVLTGESVPSVLNAVRAGIGVSALPCFATHGDASLVRLTPSVGRGAHRSMAAPRLCVDGFRADIQGSGRWR